MSNSLKLVLNSFSSTYKEESVFTRSIPVDELPHKALWQDFG